MNPEVKELWLTALRSGEYEQGAGALHTKADKYCCLGVLCALAAREGIVEESPGDVFASYFHSISDPTDYDRNYLPAAVQEWAGLDRNPRIGAREGQVLTGSALADLNDTGRSFAEIADIIEAKL